MRTSLLVPVVSVLCGPLAVPAVAATPPRKGASVSGTTSQGQRVKGRITSDGKGLQMTYEETFTCNDGKKLRLPTRYVNQRPGIKADGTVAYFKTYRDLPGNGALPGKVTERQRVTGEFTNGGKRFTGRASGSLTNGKRTCRDVIRLKLRVSG